MKILLVNKFYYRRGGDCIFTIELERLLKSKGHEVSVFSMQYPENFSSEWSKYWPSTMSKLKALTRPFGDSEVRRKFVQLLNDFKPDVVHLNNIHTQLSPIVARLAHEHNIKVFWTLHDSKLVCPCYTCMRDGEWCTDCFTKKFSVVKNRCMPGGFLGSLIGYLEAKKWNKDKLQKYCDLFLPPSKFMADTCVAGGYSVDKFRVLCNFIDLNKVRFLSFEKKEHYVYIGRLTKVKGIETLCSVAVTLPYKLIVIGGGELEDSLRERYKGTNIEFVGPKKWEEFRPILESAKFMVIPSEWSENNPLTVIEAQSVGTPVLGANIGGIPELIESGHNGMIFESGNKPDLKEKLRLMWESSFNYEQISREAQSQYSADRYVEELLKIYKSEN